MENEIDLEQSLKNGAGEELNAVDMQSFSTSPLPSKNEVGKVGEKQKQKRAILLLSVLFLLILLSVVLFRSGGEYYCRKSDGTFLSSGVCINISKMGYCRVNDNIFGKSAFPIPEWNGG